MSGNRRPEDEFFDDIEAEEARLEEQEQAELEAAEAEGDEPAAADSNDPAQILSVLDKLKAENEEMKDRTLRTIAEMDNLRKRTEREKEETAKYAITKFAKDIVDVEELAAFFINMNEIHRSFFKLSWL